MYVEFLLPLPSEATCPAWENKVITGGSCHQIAQSVFCGARFSKMPPLAASEPSPLRRGSPGDTDGHKERVSGKGGSGLSCPHTAELLTSSSCC